MEIKMCTICTFYFLGGAVLRVRPFVLEFFVYSVVIVTNFEGYFLLSYLYNFHIINLVSVLADLNRKSMTFLCRMSFW